MIMKFEKHIGNFFLYKKFKLHKIFKKWNISFWMTKTNVDTPGKPPKKIWPYFECYNLMKYALVESEILKGQTLMSDKKDLMVNLLKKIQNFNPLIILLREVNFKLFELVNMMVL